VVVNNTFEEVPVLSPALLDVMKELGPVLVNNTVDEVRVLRSALLDVVNELVATRVLLTSSTVPVGKVVVLFSVPLVPSIDVVVDAVGVEGTRVGSVELGAEVDVAGSVAFMSPPVTPNNSVDGASTPAT
jgi:hypothetical protein